MRYFQITLINGCMGTLGFVRVAYRFCVLLFVHDLGGGWFSLLGLYRLGVVVCVMTC